MGRFARYLLEYPGANAAHISVKDSIRFCCLDISPSKNVILELNSFAILHESLREVIDDFLNGVCNTNDVIIELREDIDLLFHVLTGETIRLNNIMNVKSDRHKAILKLKDHVELIIHSYDRWKNTLAEENLEDVIRSSDDILKSFNAVLKQVIKFLDNKYAEYGLVSLCFLVLALLSNMLKQGVRFINNRASRFISYYHRATNYSIIDSLANRLTELEQKNDELGRAYAPQKRYWFDESCLVIEGGIKNGFTYRIYTEAAPGQEGVQHSFLDLKDIMAKYEGARKQYAENSEMMSFVRLAIYHCNNYREIVNIYATQIDD